jgi:hypothetical protein
MPPPPKKEQGPPKIFGGPHPVFKEIFYTRKVERVYPVSEKRISCGSSSKKQQ